MSTLHLNVSRQDFEAIRSGEKKFVFHPIGPLWKRILEGREFDRVHFKCSSPDPEKPSLLACAWFGYEMQIVTVRLYKGWDSIKCFAIRVGVTL